MGQVEGLVSVIIPTYNHAKLCAEKPPWRQTSMRPRSSSDSAEFFRELLQCIDRQGYWTRRDRSETMPP
jgi:hypothetical protein